MSKGTVTAIFIGVASGLILLFVEYAVVSPPNTNPPIVVQQIQQNNSPVMIQQSNNQVMVQQNTSVVTGGDGVSVANSRVDVGNGNPRDAIERNESASDEAGSRREFELRKINVTGAGNDVYLEKGSAQSYLKNTTVSGVHESVSLHIPPDIRVDLKISGADNSIFVAREIMDRISVENSGVGNEIVQKQPKLGIEGEILSFQNHAILQPPSRGHVVKSPSIIEDI